MKAYHLFCGYPLDGSLLVFAETRNKARMKALRSGPYDWEYEYIHIRANRAEEWDKYADVERIVETNDELPEDAPPFYDDEAL